MSISRLPCCNDCLFFTKPNSLQEPMTPTWSGTPAPVWTLLWPRCISSRHTDFLAVLEDAGQSPNSGAFYGLLSALCTFSWLRLTFFYLLQPLLPLLMRPTLTTTHLTTSPHFHLLPPPFHSTFHLANMQYKLCIYDVCCLWTLPPPHLNISMIRHGIFVLFLALHQRS